jgi:biopolymer transport protein ExbB
VLDLISRGGVVMVPLILCSIVAVIIAVERWLYLRNARVDTDKLMGKVRAALERSSPQEARGVCEATPGPVSRVMAGVLSHFHMNRDDLRDTAKEIGLAEMPALDGHLSLLATMVTVAPLLGLLGTISGLIKVFHVVSGGAGNITDVAHLSGGIGDALICTFTGLSIAIPSLIIHNIFASRTDALTTDIELRVSELLNLHAKGNGKS